MSDEPLTIEYNGKVVQLDYQPFELQGLDSFGTTDWEKLRNNGSDAYNYEQDAYNTIFDAFDLLISYATDKEHSYEPEQKALKALIEAKDVRDLMENNSSAYDFIFQYARDQINQPNWTFDAFRCLFDNDDLMRKVFAQYNDGFYNLEYDKDFTFYSLDYLIRLYCVEQFFDKELERFKQSIDEAISTLNKQHHE